MKKDESQVVRFNVTTIRLLHAVFVMLVNPLGNTKKQGHMIIASMNIQKTFSTGV
jgi:hypothetical protein